MKKLMIAAAVAAMGAGAFAADCTPETPVVMERARLYEVTMNLKTTKGIIAGETINTGTVCVPGSESICLVYRAKDKTTLKGYVYVCQELCDFEGWECVFADTKRKAVSDDSSFDWIICNVISKNLNQAEAAWDFTGSFVYDDERQQTYTLKGAGYGKFVKSDLRFDNFSGNVAGTATASYDLKTKYKEAYKDCICSPSSVLTCATYEGLDWEALDTVAFGTWKMKFNKTLSNKYFGGWQPVIK